ncbi:MAG: succinate-semialdehyde dehydrogenase/glutarate-semialdehyde dehydrogenase [Saprospiraceae bacterium]|jgi:succinate-semialdehyde dehydrogenase/glutarate-semialdehyde dehydrogenase
MSNTNKTFEVTNPATGEVLDSVPEMGVEGTKAAIALAQETFKTWSAIPAKARSEALMRWYNLILDHKDELAKIITAECGKPLAESMGEVLYGASFVQWFAEEAKRIYGETIPAAANDRRLVVIKQPIGVVAAITPWNFPLAMITRKVAPAMAVGCTVVLKPAAETPLTAVYLDKLSEEAGIPTGVMNIITSEDAIGVGEELTSSSVIRKVSFTGSTRVGKLLMQQGAATVKKMSLELGGNAPFIVFDDADIDSAVKGAMASKYRNAGQTCVCVNRFLVQDGVYDEFSQKLTAAVETLNMGNGADDNIQIGPLISVAGVDKVESHVEDAVAKGAEILTGGGRSDLGDHFYNPTVLGNVSLDSKVAKEETFGPISPLFRFTTEEEAIAMANDTEFGLASYFYARDLGRVWRVGEALEYGMVGINEGIISTEVAPFGGVKESGLGREGSHHGADDFLELKYLCMGGI